MPNPLEILAHGQGRLQVIAPHVVEFSYMESKLPAPATLTRFNYAVAETYSAPPLSAFQIQRNGSEDLSFVQIHFKRRPYFVQYKRFDTRDLRCLTCLYFIMEEPLDVNDSVVLTDNLTGQTWSTDYLVDQYNPALHVNQVGFEPTWDKKAYLGYYMGSGGEVPFTIADFPTFDIVDTEGNVVHTGSWTSRLDVGYYSPPPYQKVLQADFTAFVTPGTYYVQTAGAGRSLPFRIHEGVAMQLARTSALGIYNQRCGVAVGLPYTRHNHTACHVQHAEIPLPQSSYVNAWATIADNNNNGNGQDPGVPLITSPADCLYPYIRIGAIDTGGAHHDAGDYSKYTPSVSSFIHALTFAADNCGDAGDLDNLGIPESGDGRSDVLAEAKVAADYLLKIQDTDGGFFWLCNPKEGRYEFLEGLTGDSDGVPQVVWPKTTLSTAAAVGALAELGSSPRFRTEYGTTIADSYLAAAVHGWSFLMAAISAHGLTGSFQSLFQSQWAHDDALAYAAASLFAATGESQYHVKLMAWFPDANKNGVRGDTSPTSTYQWGWWRMTFFWGAAVRAYAFAVRSGRRVSGDVNSTYMTKCENEIHAAGQYEVDSAEANFSRNAYGTSFTYDAKSFAHGTAGYYYPLQVAFNIMVSHLITNNATKLKVILQNVNYLLGSNPVNMVFISGIGLRRQRSFVSVQAFNHPWRKLPVNGHLVGAISSGVPYINDGYFHYEYVNADNSNEMSSLIFPPDGGSPQYPFYDRWSDVWNINEEWVTGQSGAKSHAVCVWLASLTALKTQPWAPN